MDQIAISGDGRFIGAGSKYAPHTFCLFNNSADTSKDYIFERSGDVYVLEMSLSGQYIAMCNDTALFLYNNEAAATPFLGDDDDDTTGDDTTANNQLLISSGLYFLLSISMGVITLLFIRFKQLKNKN